MSHTGKATLTRISRLPPRALQRESKGREPGAERKGRASALGRLARFGRKRPVLRAVITFALLIGLYYGFVHTPRTQSDIFQPYLRRIALATGGVVSLLGYKASVADTSVTSPAFSMQIVWGCDAIEPTAAFVCAVLASPVSLWSKIPGILIGALILALVNLLRIVSLFFIGVHFRRALDIMHEDVWQGAFIVFAIVLWAIWVQWATRGKRQHAHASS